jgi:Vitamin K-dependent gamma-carboxylase
MAAQIHRRSMSRSPDTPASLSPATSPEYNASPARGTRAKLHELFGVDLRSLALLRIGLGVSVLADVTMRGVDLVGLYTDQGVLPRNLLLAMDGPGVYLSAHYWASTHPLLQGTLFAISAACAMALLVGWRTRLATLACWYLVASVQIRQPLGYMGGDSILRLLLFWGLFLPLGARFSVDAAHGRARPRPDRFVSGATVALLLQVCLIYWATSVRKTGDLWWSGQAIFYALHADRWVTPLGVRLREYPSLLEPMTYATLGLELFGPFLAFVPIYTGVFRLLTVGIFWAFHVGLATTMNIGLFPLFSMVAWLPFVPTEAWTWLGSRTGTEAAGTEDWRSRLASVTAVILLIYVVVLLAERARVIPRVLPAQAIAVGTALRLQQTWDMFAPDPPKATSREEIQKTLSDGSVVIEPASTSFRWTVYVGRVGSQQTRGSPLSSSLSRFALYRCDDTAPDGVRVERLAILSHQRQIYADGPDEPVTRTLIEVQCPAAQSAVHP